jgi:hypothetical protein
MKGKKISFLALFLAVLSMTSFVTIEQDNGILNSEELQVLIEDDEQILNSKEFKAVVENRKKIKDGLALASEEQQEMLYQDLDLSSKERRNLLDRSMQQSQKVRDYLEANPTERKNRTAIEKKMFDADVLEYRTKSRLIREKYVGEFQEKDAKLHKEFKQKFPNVSNEDFRRLMKLGSEDSKNNLEKVPDEVILNSNEFKSIVEHFENSKDAFASVKEEHLRELRNSGLSEEQIEDLSKRNREQSQKRMEYLTGEREHYEEMIRDREGFDKKFFDEDVLTYKNKMRELADKYDTDPLHRKQNELHKQFRDKFPNVSPEEFSRLLKLGRKDK